MNMALCIIICFRETASPATLGGYGAIQSLARAVPTVNTVVLLIRTGHGMPVDQVSILSYYEPQQCSTSTHSSFSAASNTF